MLSMAPFHLNPFGLSAEKEIRFQVQGVYYIAIEPIAVDVDLNKSTQNECFINDVMGYDRYITVSAYLPFFAC